MITQRAKLLVLCFCVFLLPLSLYAQEILSPEKYFGHVMGEEGVLLDYMKSLDYYREIAKTSSRMQIEELGKTTDGNPFILLVISSEENMGKIDELKRKRELFSDPRKLKPGEAEAMARELPVVVFHATSIHSSEISTAQVAPELVYKMVTEEGADFKGIRENAIVLICPSANPDGQVKYNKWYSEHKGKAWEGRMPWLYHTYVGHDNNRDWVNLYFSEQRLTATEIHLKWHPVYSHEMHEFGGTSARIFFPPYKDPIDPNTAPDVVGTMNSLGMAASHALTAEGKGGVVTQAHFDLFTPARAFQVYHGTGRILTETASGRFARAREVTADDFNNRRWASGDYHPLKRSWNFPLPWQPGTWKFRDRVEYQISASLALMRQAANNRYQYNMAYFNALNWAVEGKDWPYAWILPKKQTSGEAARQLVKLLKQGGVEIHSLKADLEINGKLYKTGSSVIYLNQPYGAWAKTLLEIQNYPDLRKKPDDPPVMPYDVTGHTLPLLMGVEADKIDDPFKVQVMPLESTLTTADIAEGKGKHYAVFAEDNSASYLVNKLLAMGKKVWRLKKDTSGVKAGAFLVESKSVSKKLLEEVLDGRYAKIKNLVISDFEDKTRVQPKPRLAVYESWGGMMDAGWTRKLLEIYGFEFEVLRNEEIASGKLSAKYDVIIFPNGISIQRMLEGVSNFPRKYRVGIGAAGVENLKTFVSSGGSIITWGGSSTRVAELLDIPLDDKARNADQNKFFAPGGVVLVELDTSHPVNYGMKNKTAVQIRRGPLFIPKATLEQGPEIIGHYPKYDPRLSGFLLGQEFMQGTGSLAVQPMGKGRVILFSYLPQFRGMTHGAFKQIFNAIFWSVER